MAEEELSMQDNRPIDTARPRGRLQRHTGVIRPPAVAFPSASALARKKKRTAPSGKKANITILRRKSP